MCVKAPALPPSAPEGNNNGVTTAGCASGSSVGRKIDHW
jgi:hypothetical protein